MLNLEGEDYDELMSILLARLKRCSVYAFGSRVSGRAQKFSDCLIWTFDLVRHDAAIFKFTNQKEVIIGKYNAHYLKNIYISWSGSWKNNAHSLSVQKIITMLGGTTQPSSGIYANIFE